ncbi:RNA polymerase sigma-70 factor [Pedobacter sp. KBW06]|uniref:RNA polymerase sigma factor n=1 Tax=Pedobacter sp. KBW06 TaxID=2153359 RepID=UPI000F5A584B|nr:RNA polymerase sigma-70 factor [Pedobacter sp. KBW06]RQO72336.1 RNA polymerase sigma-70 factor [Pedobacter sp. KBW06]
MSNEPIPSPLDEDLILINAISKKDKKVFEAFYKKYYKQLFSTAYQYVGQSEAAEEIVHDLFITIWNKADQLNIQYSMKSYLFRAIVNSSLNFIKKEKMNTLKQLAWQASHEEQESFTEDGEAAENEETLLKSLEEALVLLPDKCKQVMYLSRFGKLKQQEIADQMGISLKTVKNHLTYGFQKLRNHLEKQGQVIVFLILFLKIIIR